MRSRLLVLYLLGVSLAQGETTASFRWIAVPAGKYWIGEAKHGLNPLREVTVAAYAIADAEVTNEQFSRFIEATGYCTDAERAGFSLIWREGNAEWKWTECTGAHWRCPQGPEAAWRAKNRPQHPVTQISAADALAYCAWAGVRLPTHAEWEIAARAGSRERFPWGAKYAANRANVWNGLTHHKNTLEDGYHFTAPARTYAPNAWGLYDTIGNVFEYVIDLPLGTKPRLGQKLSSSRGGSWWCSRLSCNFFNLVDTGTMEKHGSLPNQGFRVVRLPP